MHSGTRVAKNDVTLRLAIDDVGPPPDTGAIRLRLMLDTSEPWEAAAVSRGYEMRQARRPRR